MILSVLWMIAACSRGGGTGCGAKPPSVARDSGSEAADASALPELPRDPGARLEAARKALAAQPEEAAIQDAFERAWLDVEFLALDEELKERKGKAAPLELGDCGGESAKECLETRIGRRYDSSWTRAEVRDGAFLLLVFHARSGHDEDTETGNELVVFRGRLPSKQGAPLKLDVVSRSTSKVSDAVGAALGRRAVAPDPTDGSVLWDVRFEPLSPKEFAIVASLPGEWVKLFSRNNDYEVFTGTPGSRGRLFIHKEPKLRLAWLSWAERDGRFVQLLQVSRKGSTYHLGDHTRLRWKPESEDVGYVARGAQEGKGEPYVPSRYEVQYMIDVLKLDLEEEEMPEVEWDGLEETLPEAVRRELAHCTSRSLTELKPGLYEARCGCGNPCGYSTFVDMNGGRTSTAFWLPLGVDAERERVAISTEGNMPIRIVGMFDEREWTVIRRPAGDSLELSHNAEATFTGNRLHLKYHDRRWQPVEEDVELPEQALQLRPEDTRVFVQAMDSGTGIDLELRANPEVNGEVVTRVDFGTECRLLDDLPGPWVRLECAGLTGFTLGSLVGPDRPRLEEPREEAGNTKKDAGTALDAGMSEGTPDAGEEPSPELLVERFFAAHFAQLSKVKRGKGLDESFIVGRKWDAALGKKETGEAGLLRELEKIGFDWHRFQLRGNDFVSAMQRDGAVVVYTGSYSSVDGRYAIEEVEDRFRVTIQSRSNVDVPEALKLALQQGAHTAAGEQASAFETALSPEAFQLYRSLPQRWYSLQTWPGSRFVSMRCDLISGAWLHVDLHRRASLHFGQFFGTPEHASQSVPIVDISGDASVHQLRLRAPGDEQRVLTLHWPTAELNVSRWKTEPPSPTDGFYGVVNASNIDLTDYGCRSD